MLWQSLLKVVAAAFKWLVKLTCCCSRKCKDVYCVFYIQTKNQQIFDPYYSNETSQCVGNLFGRTNVKRGDTENAAYLCFISWSVDHTAFCEALLHLLEKWLKLLINYWLLIKCILVILKSSYKLLIIEKSFAWDISGNMWIVWLSEALMNFIRFPRIFSGLIHAMVWRFP